MITSAQCLQVIGNPELEKDMVLWQVPSIYKVGKIPNKIYCNKRLMEPLSKAFKALIDSGKISELESWDGCFNIRKKTQGTGYSLHSWGIAIDLNAKSNSYGATPNLSSEFVKCFTNNGFDWGGYWSTPDGMHFQIAKLD